MATIESLYEEYKGLEQRFDSRHESEVDAECLLTFDYEYLGQETEVSIDTQEFTAMCPWADLPDFGTLTVSYVPDRACIELKSLKYYLLSYRSVGIVQEHVANRVLKDLVSVCGPSWMKVKLDYKIRGGLHATVSAEYNGALDLGEDSARE